MKVKTAPFFRFVAFPFSSWLALQASASVALGQEAAPATSEEIARQSARSVDARTAIRLALAHSPAREVARLEREKARLGVRAEEGRYQFVFEADAGYTQATNPRLQQDNAISSNTSRSFVLGAGLNRTFSTGTIGEFRMQGEHFANEFSGGFVNPLLNQASGYGTSMRLTLTQPILRGAGTALGLVELHAAQASSRQADKSERRVTSQLVRDVLIAYAELWYASEALAIENRALELARRQEAEALDRVARGALAPADALSFSTRVAELEESRVTAETNERTRAFELLRLTGATPGQGGLEVWQASGPPEELVTPSRGEMEKALTADSIELAELEAAVSVARVRAEVAGDALRPRLDAEGYVESKGLGEDPGSALARTAEFGWVSGHVGLTFELPLDDTRKNAERAAALIAVSTAQANLREARDRIRAEARTSVASAEAAQRKLALAQKTREIAEKSFAAEENRFALGLAIGLQVQEADDNLRRARLREARARVDLVAEQAQLEHLMGGLIERFGS